MVLGAACFSLFLGLTGVGSFSKTMGLNLLVAFLFFLGLMNKNEIRQRVFIGLGIILGYLGVYISF